MSHWKFIKPKGITNLVANPSFETGVAGWGVAGTNTRAQTAVQSMFGLYSVAITYSDNLVLLQETAFVLPLAGTYTLQCYVYVPGGWSGGNISIRAENYTGSTRSDNQDWIVGTSDESNWVLISDRINVEPGDLTGDIRIRTSIAPAVGASIYLDAIQIAPGADVTTYCDGDQPGCYWNGIPHASTSTRSGESRAGGYVRDFKDDYGLGQAEWVGTGMSPVAVSVDPYALLPGGELNNIKTQSRPFSLIGTLKGEYCDCNINAARRELVEELAHDTYPKDHDNWQPVRIRYDTITHVETEVYYLTFNGTTSVVNCGTDPALDDLPAADFTAEAWIRATGWGETGCAFNGRIFDKTDCNMAGWVLTLYNHAQGGILAYIYGAAFGNASSGLDDFTVDDQWHHIAMTWELATLTFRLFIDGVEPSYASQTPLTAPYTVDNTYDFCIGNNPTQLATFDGDIGWSRISSGLRYTANFTAPDRCVLPAIDASTVAQWIGVEGAGAKIDNQEGTSALDGTQTDCAFVADCEDAVCITETRQIEAHYEQGLGANIQLENRIHEKLSLRFIAPDPYWYEVGDSAEVLDTNDTDTLRAVCGRLISTGQWDGLSVGAMAGTTAVYALAWGPDNNLYVGGAFTTIDGVGFTSRIAMYDPETAIWTPLQRGATDNIIYALTFDPAGNLYAAGTFTSMDNGGGPVANTRNVAMWDGTNWVAMGTGGAGGAGTGAYALVVDHDGDLFIGAETGVTFGGVGNTDRIARWNGAAWFKVSTGAWPGVDNNVVYALAVGLDNTLYVGGTFTAVDNGTGASRIAQWDGAAWSILSTGFNGLCFGLAVDPSDGLLYACGTFGTAGGVTASIIAKWNGTAWSQLTDETIDDFGYWLKFGPDGMLYFGGLFTTIGSLTLTDAVAKWNGASWAHMDLNLPGGPQVRAIEIGYVDPVVRSNYDVFLGFNTTGAAYFSGTTTVANDGTAPAFPQFIIERSLGTSATLTQIRNETTGKILLFDYSLNDGEILTIDLTPTEKSVVSNFFGKRFDTILANSDTGEFSLQPGANQITCFVDVVGGPTITAYVQFKDTYKSFD